VNAHGFSQEKTEESRIWSSALTAPSMFLRRWRRSKLPLIAEFMMQLVHTLGGDRRFAAAYEQLKQMRPGALRSGLLQQQLAWDRLTEKQRTFLAEQVAARAVPCNSAGRSRRRF
jgi:hypothetical protein